ncbi:MAG: hypothetical protein HC877_23020 [Thioploca sp.]|nr:hypothetical protein [Thioploca sp.]
MDEQERIMKAVLLLKENPLLILATLCTTIATLSAGFFFAIILGALHYATAQPVFLTYLIPFAGVAIMAVLLVNSFLQAGTLGMIDLASRNEPPSIADFLPAAKAHVWRLLGFRLINLALFLPFILALLYALVSGLGQLQMDAQRIAVLVISVLAIVTLAITTSILFLWSAPYIIRSSAQPLTAITLSLGTWIRHFKYSFFTLLILIGLNIAVIFITNIILTPGRVATALLPEILGIPIMLLFALVQGLIAILTRIVGDIFVFLSLGTLQAEQVKTRMPPAKNNPPAERQTPMVAKGRTRRPQSASDST